MRRDELAPELRKSAATIRTVWPQLTGYAEQLEQAATLLEDDSLETDAKRWRAIRRLAKHYDLDIVADYWMAHERAEDDDA